jgi:surfactin synthase thioesterase subunit
VTAEIEVLVRRPHARWRLYCLPPGGLGPEFFLPWCAHVPADVELCAVRLPGRGPLADRPCATDTRVLTATLARLVAESDPRPFALYGHSSGALLAYTTACLLQRAHHRPPALLTASALPAPHSGDYARMFGELLVSGHSNAARTLGFPVSTADPGRLIRAYLPLLGDLLLLLQHRHRDEPPLECDVALHGGRDDPVVASDRLLPWNDLASTPVVPRLFPGGHTFPVEQAAAVVSALSHDLRAAGSQAP